MAWVLVVMALLALVMALLLAAIGRPPLIVGVACAVAPLCAICWWLNRRGSATGAVAFVVMMAAATALGFDPHLYAGTVPVVDVAFTYSVAAAALFVRPAAGFAAVALQIGALAAALAASDIPATQARAFLEEAVLELGAVAALLATAAQIYIRALTDAQRRAQALTLSEARGRRLIEANVVGIAVTDSRGSIRQINDALLSLLRTTRNEINSASATAAAFIAPQFLAAHGAALEQVRRSGHASYESALITRSGEQVPVLISGAQLDHSDEIVSFVLDLSEQKRHEEERRARAAAEAANDAKTKFLASISHELRTPLNAILGFAQVMESDPHAAPPQRRRAALIHEAGDHLLSLVEDVLDIARIEANRLDLVPSTFDLLGFLDAVHETASPRCKAKGLSFSVVGSATLPRMICADERRLRQVLLNLLENACKFTDSGSVTLMASASPSSTRCRRLRFEVRDTGCGIAIEDLERVFEPFAQAGAAEQRAAGAGLGLAISRQLVRLMGGNLQLRSEPGVGSSFFFEVDAAEVQPVHSEQAQRVPSGYANDPLSVLIVDDIEVNRMLLREVLGPLGFEVLEAANGQRAYELACEHKPDLILIDSVMPVLDGVTAIRLMRARPELDGTAIISLSASTTQADRQRCVDAGATHFLAKPLDLPALFGALERSLGLTWTYSD